MRTVRAASPQIDQVAEFVREDQRKIAAFGARADVALPSRTPQSTLIGLHEIGSSPLGARRVP